MRDAGRAGRPLRRRRLGRRQCRPDRIGAVRRRRRGSGAAAGRGVRDVLDGRPQRGRSRSKRRLEAMRPPLRRRADLRRRGQGRLGRDDGDGRRRKPRALRKRPSRARTRWPAKVYRLGATAGNGSKVKIINQLLAGVHIAAAAEAMALGLREGVDAGGAVRGHHAQRRQQLDVREPRAARPGRRLHAALGGRHLRQGPRPGARYRAREQVSAAAGEPRRTRCSCRRRPPAIAQGRRLGGDQDLPRHRAAASQPKTSQP